MGAKGSKLPTADTVSPSSFSDLGWPVEAIEVLLDQLKEERAAAQALDSSGDEEEGRSEEQASSTVFDLEDKCIEYGMGALHYAAEAGHVDAVRVLLGRRPSMVDLRSVRPEKREELDMSDKKAWKEKKARLGALASPFAAQCRCYPGTTPLMIAARHGHWESAEVLLSFGADVGATDENGRTPLHMACRFGQAQVVDVLAAHMEQKVKRDLLDARDENGQTPIHYLAQGNDYMEHVELFGKDVTHHRRMGDIVVVFKSEDDYRIENQVHIFRKMLSLRAKPELEDNEGFTPLYYAARSQAPILAILLQMGCNPEGRFGDEQKRYRMWLNGNKYGPEERDGSPDERVNVVEEPEQQTTVWENRRRHEVDSGQHEVISGQHEADSGLIGVESDICAESEQHEIDYGSRADRKEECERRDHSNPSAEDDARPEAAQLESIKTLDTIHSPHTSSSDSDSVGRAAEESSLSADDGDALAVTKDKVQLREGSTEALKSTIANDKVFSMPLSALSPEGYYQGEKISLDNDDDEEDDDDDHSMAMTRRR